MLFDLFEVAAGGAILFLMRKHITPYLRYEKRTIALTLIYGGIYALCLYLMKDTYLDTHALTPFTAEQIVQGSVLFLLLYALALVTAEELIFRVYTHYKHIHTLIAAALFSVAHWRPEHFPILMFPILFVFALMQSTLLKKTHSFFAVFGAHLITLITLVLLYSE